MTRKRPKALYDDWLNPAREMADPPQADARELFEFVVLFVCDTNELDADKLAEMSANREPIRSGKGSSRRN